MNICIDGFGVTDLKGTGHYTYTKNLIEGLLEGYPQSNYSLLWQGKSLSENWKKQRIVCENLEVDRKKNNLLLLEQYLVEKKISLYHSPNNGFSIPDNKVCKYVITVHDLIAKTHAELVDVNYRNKFEQVFTKAEQRADKIIAVSKFIKWELESYYNIDAEKIQVVYPWYNKVESTDMSISRAFLKNKYNITNDYILSIGSIHLRKNLMTLIRSFKSSDLFKEGFKLVIAGEIDGKRQNHYLELRALAERLELSDSIVFIGNVDYEEVQHLYNCASCMISLSEYEGFPQVFLEAMTFGVPVICGRNSSFEEVVGSAGHYIDIKDVVQIKKTLRQVTLNESNNKVNEGFRQSAKFEKRESVKSIVSIYENSVY